MKTLSNKSILMRTAMTLFLTVTAYAGTWAQDPAWLKTGDTWDAGTKTLTVNSNPAPNAYYNKKDIANLVIADAVTEIGSWAFQYCRNLTSVVLGSGLTTIGNGAFSYTNLTAVSIPASVTTISRNPFDNCLNLTAISVVSGNANYKDIDGVLFTKDGTTLVAYPAAKTATSYDIPDGVTAIGDEAFNHCFGLTSVNIPVSVTSIGDWAFMNCYNLASVNIPANVTTIGDYAFSSTEIVSVSIPASVTSISDCAFLGCEYLTEISVDGANTYYKSEYGVLFSKDGTSLITYPMFKSGTSYDIPSGVTTISDDAFLGCLLTSITIPATVTTIGIEAFSDCYNLASISFADGIALTDIPDYAFSACWSLTSITIPTSVTTIGDNAFWSCTGLTSIIIPAAVASIGTYAFQDCTSITDVYFYPATTVTWDGSSDFMSGKGTRFHVKEGSDCTALVSNVNATFYDDLIGTAPLTANLSDNPGEYWTTYYNNGSDNIIASAGTEVYKAALGATSVALTEISDGIINSGQGVVMKSSTSLIPLLTSASASADDYSSNELQGYGADTPVASGKTYYVLDKGSHGVGFYDYSGTTLTANKAFFVAGSSARAFYGFEIAEFCLNKTELVIEKGKTDVLTATCPSSWSNKSVTWKSSDPTIVKVSSAGKIKGVKVGTATITCTSVETGATATCEVTVGLVRLSKSEATIPVGKSGTLRVTVYPETLEDKNVTWESSDTKVVTVTSKGKVKAVGVGTAIITCTSNATGLSATCTLTVGKVRLSKTKATIPVGKSGTLRVTVYPETLEDKSVTWETSDKKVVTVTSTGKVKAVGVGTAIITCTSNATGLSATCTLTVGKVVLSKTKATVYVGKTGTLRATVYPETLEDKSVTWKSSDPNVATVTSTGKVRAVGPGAATITCTSNATGLSATCKLTVSATASARSLGGDDDDNATGIDEMIVAVEPFDVYDLRGRKVRHQVTSLDDLPNGVYIVNGKKVLKKD